MAIIRSSKTFEGGEFKQSGTRYIKAGLRTMNFYDKKLMDGAYVFILGAYKEDGSGNGVWYKPLKIRDNFGMDTKEKFAVQPNCPVDYFANKVKTHAPNLARVEKIKGEDGRDRNVYPAFGRTTWRVLYNAAFFNDMAAGVHVLDLPQSGGASAIDEFVKGKGPDGAENPDITDYTAAIPVHIKLDLKASGQPWKISVNNAKVYTLPVELADTDYLYNLDDVVIYPSKQELIEKLKTLFPADIFNKCIAGYSDGSVTVSMATPSTVTRSVGAPPPPPTDDDGDLGPQRPAPTPIAKPASIPKATVPTAAKPAAQAVAPAFNLPKATRTAPPKAAELQPDPQQESGPEVQQEDDLPRPPVATTSASPADIARQFLKRPQA